MSVLDVTRIRKINEEDHKLYNETVEKLKKESETLDPEYVVLINGQVSGAFQVIPAVLWWMSEGISGKWNSLVAFNTLDNLIQARGYSEYVIPCTPDSPYSKLMPKLFDGCREQINLFTRIL